jgi:hypothetical protein
LVQQNWSASQSLQLGGATNVVDVRVRNDDLLHGQTVTLYRSHHFFDVVSRIDDDPLSRLLISDDRAIALQWADGKDFVDHDFQAITNRSHLRHSGSGA